MSEHTPELTRRVRCSLGNHCWDITWMDLRAKPGELMDCHWVCCQCGRTKEKAIVNPRVEHGPFLKQGALGINPKAVPGLLKTLKKVCEHFEAIMPDDLGIEAAHWIAKVEERDHE